MLRLSLTRNKAVSGAAAALAVAMLGAAPAAARPAHAAAIDRARWLMGTVCTIHAEGADTARAAAAVEAAFGTIDRLEDVLSSWRPRSELSRVNGAANGPAVPCSDDLFAVLDSALVYARATRGAFDPTVEPLDQAWDLRGHGRTPSADELANARDRTGYAHLEVHAAERSVHFGVPGMGLDLGGIGKGYALDRAADTLRAHGVTRALLDFGGEMLAVGDGAAWPATIADPAHRLRPALGLPLDHGALSVSGQSERFVVVAGHRYGHIVDPRTGRPVPTRASVAVRAASGTQADCLSTALLVLGRAGARAFARAHPDIAVVWLEPSGRGVRAWRWNSPRVTALPGVSVAWQP